jgi:hypothetical protein
MSKEKGKRFDTGFDDDNYDDVHSVASAASSASAAPTGFDFVITSKPMSKKNRKVAEASAAKAAEEARQKASQQALKDAAERRQKLFTLFPQFAPKPPPPRRPSVTCEKCGAPKPEGAVGWRESSLGFSSQGTCPKCAVPRPRPIPKLVWLDQPDALSVWQHQLVEKSSKTTDSPGDKHKARMHSLSTLRPSSLDAREKLLMQTMKSKLMSKLKQKPKGGTRRKSKSKSKSKSRKSN